jgi:predicted Fe-Mo cluster-binding NifX family protein
MRYCFPIAKEKGLDSKVFGHFGSAPMFLLVDAGDSSTEVVAMPPREQHGGCAPVAQLASFPFDALVVGGIGPGAVAKLTRLGKRVFLAKAVTVQENLDLLAQGALQESDPAGWCRDPGHGHGAGGGGCGGHGHGHGGR